MQRHPRGSTHSSSSGMRVMSPNSCRQHAHVRVEWCSLTRTTMPSRARTLMTDCGGSRERHTHSQQTMNTITTREHWQGNKTMKTAGQRVDTAQGLTAAA